MNTELKKIGIPAEIAGFIKETHALGDGEALLELDAASVCEMRGKLSSLGWREEKKYAVGSTRGVLYTNESASTLYLYENCRVPFARAVLGAKMPHDNGGVGEPIYRDTVFYQAQNIPNPLKGAMTYIIRLRDGRFAVIDGGGEISVEGFFAALNELHPKRKEGEPYRIAAWFITHPHDDHIELLKRLLADKTAFEKLEIKRMYANLPDEIELRGADDNVIPDNNFVRTAVFDAVSKSGGTLSKPFAGMTFLVGELRIEVMYTQADWFSVERKTVNDASMMFRITRDGGRSVLITGDIMDRVAVYFMKMYSADELHADAVQIAHHAHAGPDITLYEMIQPKIFFWPISEGCYFLPDDHPYTVRNNLIRQKDAVHLLAYLGASQIML